MYIPHSLLDPGRRGVRRRDQAWREGEGGARGLALGACACRFHALLAGMWMIEGLAQWIRVLTSSQPLFDS